MKRSFFACFTLFNIVFAWGTIQSVPALHQYSLKALSEVSASEKKLLNCILTNPVEALSLLNQAAHKHCMNIDCDVAPQVIRSSYRLAQEECSIALMHECQENVLCQPCCLSRAYNPKFREIYEDLVVASILEKLNAQEIVRYASFASGGCFQDLVILTKVLNENPRAKIDIDIIDLEYRDYVWVRDEVLKNGREVSDGYDIISSDVAKMMIEEDKKWDDEEQAITFLTFTEMFLQQFIGFLKRHFPEAKLSLSVHCSAKSYWDYLNNNRLCCPDVVTTADSENPSSLETGSVEDYSWLALGAIFNNPNSSNFTLFGADQVDSPTTIGSFFLHEVPGSEPISVDLLSGETVPIWWKATVLEGEPKSIFRRVIAWVGSFYR